jgi:urease accessory protein
MIIKEKSGRLDSVELNGRVVERLPLEWFETGKRILHKKTEAGRQVILKFLKEAQNLTQDDVLFEDEQVIIVVDIVPCDTIVLKPSSMYAMAFACYEIGNKHLPLFYEADSLLIPFEAPLFRVLEVQGLNPARENRKLIHQLRTTVAAHAHSGNGSGLFSKILQLTNSSNG